MSRRRAPEAQALHDLDAQLTAQLRSSAAAVLRRVSRLRNRNITLPSLHGIIGGKNNTYVDSIRTQFPDPNDFLAQWIRGLLNSYGGAADSLVQLLKDPKVLEYTRVFLTRNFYRNLLARTRAKPSESLWSLWFGNSPLVWGLIIAPVRRNKVWTNDVSEIRRAQYKYWTIGHIMETGLIDPTQTTPVRFADVPQFLTFYRSVLSRVSNSVYEKGIADRYSAYLAASQNVLDEPFLVPELRYAGLETKHEYRLDFSVLNAHVMEFTGFELSPASTHMAIAGLKTKKQVQVNRELADKWKREMTKRNKYFSQFGITTMTFMGGDLEDLDQCFEAMAVYLRRRPKVRLSLDEQLEELVRA